MQFNPEVAAEICRLMAEEGLSLRQICKRDDMPARSTVHKWLNEHPEFSDQYARAREQMLDSMAEEILEISDDSDEDTVIGEGGNIKPNTEWINRARLRVDSRKWLLSKLLPKKYGDKQILDIGEDTLKRLPDDKLQARITALLGRVGTAVAPGGDGQKD